MSKPVVVIDYAALKSGEDLSSQLLEAWGPGTLGVIAVRGIPQWQEKYTKVLKLSHSLAHLPQESLAKLEHEPSMWNAGWSFGKEKFGDKPDFAKGSFYFNPLNDAPGTPEDREKFPWALPLNLWPAELPELEKSCKELGTLMHEVTTCLGQLVDRTVGPKVPGYDAELGRLMKETEKVKGRLLYYFPPAEQKESPSAEAVPEDGWIGWHNDSGFLTALTPDMYVDDVTGEVIENPDPESAGLWVVDRDGGSVHVSIPKDCMAVQVGECTQVVTGGALIATPHCVRGCRPNMTNGKKVARVSCPCFIDVHPAFPVKMPNGGDRDSVLGKSVVSKVPPLGERWVQDGMTFGDFLGSSFRKYYEWNTAKAA
mmetsp:Transcript_8003/g.17842  ORF Transcript_8003/g.17842 Transcript_8003/m.17842 type:complete len:369 (+) Transcript_8003:91-1197(+)|eukprot:CAMPEP_0178423146 /NCGR_PEP_ID=MMETSP0689_2-20121128/27539_1 /TAXON_ID=160604 /ORGANISM="Amphidinium massartii, Strain CS-259" /LENGTH=368 /DNA_ID=CAMNT_0020044733 /DNA_START=79 /DNA_END=1185 /DNA_ORIENTATION=-